MRLVPFLISAAATAGLIVVLNMQLPAGTGKTPRLGYFLSPHQGFWKNAEPVDKSFDEDIKLPGVKKQVDVYVDDRLVPHVYAESDADAYYIQGYLHARFRLWQMEFQTHVAAGRLSEIVGADRIKTDQYFRRLGMVSGADKTLKMMEADPSIKEACDAYTAGVNAYINSLKPEELPFEYKLLNYKPEPWNNLKTALFLKFMSWDLSGRDEDLKYTNARNAFSYDDFIRLYPNHQDTLDPIIPRGTQFDTPSIKPLAPVDVDSAYRGKYNVFTAEAPVNPPKANGSNNWAVGGSKTKSGRPILCNDPHLGLNLPSLWFEMQISTPTHNTYGATFPGSPAVIIGFNDSCAWGVTNAGRDVKDYYQIKFKDASMQEYWFQGHWKQTEFRKEVIKVKGGKDVVENIATTVFGPVMYDQVYKATDGDSTGYYAVRWKAQDESNELRTFYQLNRARNYVDYVEAIVTFECPGQNFVFAARNGDIAIRQQGMFPAKWKNQGDFVMPGIDSSYMWQGYIPAKENPQMSNPARGFVSSANQQATDSTYPYYLGHASLFPPYRGYIINRKLTQMSNIVPEDMQMLQTDNYNVFAEICRPVLLANIAETGLNDKEKQYLQLFKDWNLRNDVNEKAATIFYLWWDTLETQVYKDEIVKAKVPLPWPDESVLIESLMKDSAYKFIDDVNTPAIETLQDIMLRSFKKAVVTMASLEKEGKLEWAKYKDTYVKHLLGIPVLGRLHLPIGGGSHIINATKENHGPSWRMIVHLTDDVDAYGVYPGGQSGNPGSKYYDTFVDTWANGRYYKLVFLKKADARKDSRIKWHMVFYNS